MDERFVFGPALVEAVDLEKKAKWPRIVLSDTAIALEREHSRFYALPLQSMQSSCLCSDQDEEVFVDHLGICIDEEHDHDTGNLCKRVRDQHLSRSTAMGNSALRRNFAEGLGIGSAADIKAGLVRPSTQDVKLVADWLDKCEIGWQECDTKAEATALARELKRQFKPPLNVK